MEKKKLFRSHSEDTQHVSPWHMNGLSWYVLLNVVYKNHPLFLEEE